MNSDKLNFLEEQHGELKQVVEAIRSITATDEWKRLKRLLLDDLVSNLERQLAQEATKAEIDTKSIYRLQGQLLWAHKYADLDKLADAKRQQIENIKNQITHEQIPRDGAL